MKTPISSEKVEEILTAAEALVTHLESEKEWSVYRTRLRKLLDDLNPPEVVEEVKPAEIYPEKTLDDQLRTIETFGFGVENYTIKNGQYIRNKA